MRSPSFLPFPFSLFRRADSSRAHSLALHARHDFLTDIARRGFISVEVHRVGRAPLRGRPQVRRVAEHLGERHARVDDLRPAAVLLRLDLAAPAREVTHDASQVLLRHDDLDAHHRLEQHRPSLLRGVLEGHGAGDLERHFRRVDVVVRTVVELDAHIVHWVAGEHAARERFLDAFVDRLDEFPRDRAARDLVLEDVAGSRLPRIQVDLRVAVLTAPARLLRVLHLAVGRARDRFLVGDLRTAGARVDVELTAQAVDDDFEMQLAHAGDDDFAGGLVGLHTERRVFGHELAEPLPELFLVGLRLRLNRQRDDRLGEVHRLEYDRLLLVADRVAGRHALQPDGRRDVPRVDFLDFLALVRAHLQQAAETLRLPLGRVVDRGAGRHDAGVHADERELTDVRG